MAVNVFDQFVQTADSFRNEVNGSVYEWFFESLVHTIRSKRRFIQKLNTEMFLGDAQQFCCGFIGNSFVGKTEQKQTILCLKYNKILTYLLNCCIKSKFALVLFGTNSTRVIALAACVILLIM